MVLAYFFTLYFTYNVFDQIFSSFSNNIQMLAHPNSSLSYLSIELQSSTLTVVQSHLSLIHLQILKTNIKKLLHLKKRSEYPQSLFDHLNILTSVKNFNDWALVIECFSSLANVLHFNGFSFEAAKILMKSFKLSMKLAKGEGFDRVLLGQVLIDLFYQGRSKSLNEVLLLLKEMNDQESLVIKCLVSVKLGRVSDAEDLFMRIKDECSNDSRNFLCGLFLVNLEKTESAFKSFFQCLTANKFFNPAIRKWCLHELQGIYKKDSKFFISSKNSVNQVLFMVETGLEPEFEQVLLKKAKKILKKLAKRDFFSFCWFGKDLYQVCPLISLKNYRQVISRCLKNPGFTDKRANLSKALLKAAKKISFLQNDDVSNWLFNQETMKTFNRLIILITSDKSYLLEKSLKSIDTIFKDLKINLLIFSLSPKSHPSTKKLLSSIHYTKLIQINSSKELDEKLSKVYLLFS
jgi:tetratricopeptide (TPR) repeat protein